MTAQELIDELNVLPYEAKALPVVLCVCDGNRDADKFGDKDAEGDCKRVVRINQCIEIST